MRASSLLLLREDPLARAAAAAWPLLTKHPTNPRRVPRRVIEQWSAYSDVDPDDLERLFPRLLAHGLVQPDGTLHPIVEKYLARLALHGVTREDRRD